MLLSVKPELRLEVAGGMISALAPGSALAGGKKMLCFLLGSTDRSILVHKVVEFIEFDHEVQDLIRVVADFYLENRASEDSRLLAIHPRPERILL